MLASCWLSRPAGAGQPRISLFERLGTNQVTIHFDTEANRRYVLQYIDTLSCPTNATLCSSNGVPTGTWTDLYTVKPFFMQQHFIIPVTMTNRHQFYRLTATP